MKRLAFERSQAVYDFKLRSSVAGSDDIDAYLEDATVQAELDRCRYARRTGKNVTTFIMDDDPEMIQILSAPMRHRLEGHQPKKMSRSLPSLPPRRLGRARRQGRYLYLPEPTV